MAASLLSPQALVLTDSLSKKQSLVARARSQGGNQGPGTEAPPSLRLQTPITSTLHFAIIPISWIYQLFVPFGLKYLLTAALQLGHHSLSYFCPSLCHVHVCCCPIFSVSTLTEPNTPGYKYDFCYFQTV